MDLTEVRRTLVQKRGELADIGDELEFRSVTGGLLLQHTVDGMAIAIP